MERGAPAQGQRRGPASRLSTPPYATTEVRLTPPSSGTPGRNGGTPLHTACSVRLNAFHIRQHRGHTRGHRPGRPRPRVASHGSYSLSRPSRVPNSRGMSAEQGPGEECPVVRVVHQVADDPVDAPPPRTLGRGPRVPLTQAGGSMAPLMGQSVRAPPDLRPSSWLGLWSPSVCCPRPCRP